MDRHAEVAYEAIAPVYDEFTAHHDYETRIAMLLALAAENGLRAGASRALDVGCGTGKSFKPLLDRGWEVTACDISASMAALARERAGDRVRIEVADMRELPVLGSFDIAFCIDDAVNYLHSAEELTATLRAVAANLEPDGLLIFDSNTISVYRGFFAEQFEVETGGVRMIWEGHGDGNAQPGTISEASFSFEPLEGGAAAPPRCTASATIPSPRSAPRLTPPGWIWPPSTATGPRGSRSSRWTRKNTPRPSTSSARRGRRRRPG